MSVRPTRFVPFTAACVASLATVSFVVPAHAAEASQSREVRYHDLDLTTDAGAAQLNHRIRRAALAVCGDADVRDLTAVQDLARCRAAALADAAPRYTAALAAAHQDKQFAGNGGSAPRGTR